MMKKLFFTALFALAALAGQAQEIKRITASLEDFMEHMAMLNEL